jgi:hypothetical protein
MASAGADRLPSYRIAPDGLRFAQARVDAFNEAAFDSLRTLAAIMGVAGFRTATSRV